MTIIQHRDCGDEQEGSMSDEQAAELNMKVRAFDNQRLFDLVRYCRHRPHEYWLITDGELGWLVEQSSSSARRLEDNDALRAVNERLLREQAEFTGAAL